MATTSLWHIKGRLGDLIDYVENPEKTVPKGTEDFFNVFEYVRRENKTREEYVSTINCAKPIALQQMILTKKQYGKNDNYIAWHGYQSFKVGEVEPQLAHEIGVKLAKEMWGDRFQIVVTTHLDKDHMEKYSFGKAVSAVDVLTTRYEDNPDALLKVLFCVVDLLKLYKAQQYGSIIQILKGNKSIFSKESWNIQTHNDKETVFNSLKRVFNIMESKDKTIADLIICLADAHLLNEAYLSGIVDDDDYKLAELVPVIEVVHVADYLCNPRVSTQHGVKGESHDSVVFVAEDSSGDPRVAMYRFFEMWGQIQISAKMLNRFYYDFAAEVGNIQRSIGIKVSDLKKDTYAANEEMIKEKIHTVFDRFKDDLYFQFIYGADYESYFSKPGVTKAKDCLKDNTAYSILSAYKLFYVGCSRARRNLTILLDSSKIKGNLELQKKRFEEIGFQVIVPQCIRT